MSELEKVLDEALFPYLTPAGLHGDAARAALRAIEEAGYEIRKRDDIQEVSRRAQEDLKL